MTLMEVNAVSEVVTSLADPAANVIFGSVVDEKYSGEIAVTVIATGFQPAGAGGKFRESSTRDRRQAPPPPAPRESSLPWNRGGDRRSGGGGFMRRY
jgi:cell division protein FtsZ